MFVLIRHLAQVSSIALVINMCSGCCINNFSPMFSTIHLEVKRSCQQVQLQKCEIIEDVRPHLEVISPILRSFTWHCIHASVYILFLINTQLAKLLFCNNALMNLLLDAVLLVA